MARRQESELLASSATHNPEQRANCHFSGRQLPVHLDGLFAVEAVGVLDAAMLGAEFVDHLRHFDVETTVFGDLHERREVVGGLVLLPPAYRLQAFRSLPGAK